MPRRPPTILQPARTSRQPSSISSLSSCLSDESDRETASGVWVPSHQSSPRIQSSSSSDSEPRTQRTKSARDGKRKRTSHMVRSTRRGRHERAKRSKRASRGRFSRSDTHSKRSSSAPSGLSESSGDEPQLGRTRHTGGSLADFRNDGCEVAVLDRLVHAPELDRKVFESWGVLEAYLKMYSKQTFQIFSVRTNTPVHKRNQRIKQNMSSYTIIPEEVQFYNRTYVCTHHGDPRQSRNQGRRPHQSSRMIGCKAQINACVQETGNWEVRITKQVTGHNHVVSSEAYQTYHEARVVSDDEVIATVQTLYRAGANRKRILEYIAENTTVVPQMKDVHNLVARLQEEAYVFPQIEDRIRAILEDFASQEGNIARVYANEARENLVECISIQSAHMRTMFEHFPEILLIDATHDTNDSNYKLFSFMVHDAMGKGQHVQHCLIENERKATLRIACQQFKESCPSFDSVAVIMIDKDFTEMVEEVAKEKYNLDAWTKKEMKRLIQLLVSAPTQVMYNKVIAAMKVVLRSDGKQQLWFSYFDTNWTECKEMWSSIFRGNVPHMGNHTNNRLESSWQKLKSLVNRSTSLDDCAVSILFWQTVNEKMWSRNVNRIGVYVNADYDPEMNMLLNTISRHAVDLVKQQYDFALLLTTEYRYYPLGPYVMLQYTASTDEDIPDEYMINPDGWTCSCIFRVTRLLPCRHITYYRKAINCERLIPECILHPRWLIKNYRKLQRPHVVCDAVEPFAERKVPALPATRVKPQHEKFKELLAMGKQIADVGCEWGTKGHNELMISQQKFLESVKAGRCPEVIIPGECSLLVTDYEEAREGLNQTEAGALNTDQGAVHGRPDEHTGVGAQPQTDVQPELGVQSHRDVQPECGMQPQIDLHRTDDDARVVDNPPGDEDDIQLSPNGRTVYSLLDDLDSSSLAPAHLENMSEVLEEPEQSETVPATQTVPATEVAPAREVSSTPTEHSLLLCNASDAGERTPAQPQWTIAEKASRAGRAKTTQASRKKATNEALRQSSRLVSAIAAGNVPSLAVLEDTIQSGVTYSAAVTLRALTILQQSRRAKITVCERKHKPPTRTDTIMTVLPLTRLDTCGSQVAHFQNRWYSDREKRITKSEITVMTGRIVYSVDTLKAMRLWHRLIEHLDGIDAAIKWVQAHSTMEWKPSESEWSEGLVDPNTLVEHLKKIDSQSEYYWVTSLCGRTQVDGPCIDLGVQAIIQRWKHQIAIFTLPSDILRLPLFDSEWIQKNSVWEQLKIAASRMDLETEKLFFFGVINYNLNHWCAVSVNLSNGDVKVYDPQQTGDRFKHAIHSWQLKCYRYCHK